MKFKYNRLNDRKYYRLYRFKYKYQTNIYIDFYYNTIILSPRDREDFYLIINFLKDYLKIVRSLAINFKYYKDNITYLKL